MHAERKLLDASFPDVISSGSKRSDETAFRLLPVIYMNLMQLMDE